MGGFDWGLFNWNMFKKSLSNGLPYSDMVFWDYVKRNVQQWGNKEAVVDTFYGTDKGKRRRKTWKQVYDDCNNIIFNLANLGIRKEHMVVTQLPNVIENYYASIFISKLSLVYLCAQVELGEKDTKGTLEAVNPDVTIVVPSYHERDIAKWHLEYQKDHPSLKYIFVVHKPGESIPEGTRSFTELLNPDIRKLWDDTDLDYFKTDPFEPLHVIPSGGTTGIPKPCISSQATFQATIHDIYSKAGFVAYDSCLIFGPMNGGTGRIIGVWTTVMAGAKAILLTEYNEKDSCMLTEDEKVNKWICNPALMIRSASSPYFDQYDLSSLRSISYAGAPFPIEIADKLWSRGVRIGGCYGSMSVPSAGMVSITENNKDVSIGTSGLVPPGDEYKIVDAKGDELPPGEVGEVWIWSAHQGFYNNPEMTRESYDENGYQHTGDIGFKDERGGIKIVGRSTDMILRGGANIYPKEIEDLLSKHPKVREIAVVPMPDKLLGEKACAYVVPMENAKITLRELTNYLQEKNVTKYKWPERLEIIAEMPISTGGKITKARLKEDIVEKLKKEGAI